MASMTTFIWYRARPAAGLRPSEDGRGRLRAHQFRKKICVEYDYLSNRGGSRTGTAGCGSRSSTPPSGAKRRRIAFVRFGSGWSRSLA
jgi:hypothetical protein